MDGPSCRKFHVEVHDIEGTYTYTNARLLKTFLLIIYNYKRKQL
jgi:hypothetical protein